MAEPVLRVENIRRLFDVSKPWLERVVAREKPQFLRAVDEVSFAIKPGETFALVGESGSGKSVTCFALLGLLPTPPPRNESGSARFGGHDAYGFRGVGLCRGRATGAGDHDQAAEKGFDVHDVSGLRFCMVQATMSAS